jgi:hypothetical protein
VEVLLSRAPQKIDWEQYAVPQQDSGPIDWEQFAVKDSPQNDPAQEDAFVENFYNLPPEEQQSTLDEILRWGARELFKPAVQGAAGIVDLPASLYNLAGLGVQAAGGPNIGQAPYVSDAVGEGVDALTGGYSEGEPGVIGKGVEFATSVGTGGGVASKLAKQAAKTGSQGLARTAKAAQFTGSTNPLAVTGAGVTGATTKGLEEMSVDPLSSLGGGLGAGMATQALGSALTKKPGLRAAGLGPKNLNTEALQAAERQSLDLPNFVASDSKTMGLASQMGARTPVIGDKMQKNTLKAGEDFFKATKKLADTIGPELNDATKETVKKLYTRAQSFLKDKDVVQPQNLTKEILKIEQEIGQKAIQSPKTKALVQDLQQLKNNLGVSQFEGTSFRIPLPPPP